MTFPRFIMAGAVNSLLSYGMYLGMLHWLPYIWAYTVAYVAGIAIGYLLNAYWVFRTRPSYFTIAAYPLAYAINYLVGIAMLWGFVEMLHISEELSPILVLFISATVMYMITRALFQQKAES